MGIGDTYSLTMIILFVITFGMYIHSPVLAQSDNMAVQGSNTMTGSTGVNNITNLGILFSTVSCTSITHNRNIFLIFFPDLGTVQYRPSVKWCD